MDNYKDEQAINFITSQQYSHTSITNRNTNTHKQYQKSIQYAHNEIIRKNNKEEEKEEEEVPTPVDFTHANITWEEVSKAIQHYKNNKSPGQDHIVNECFKSY